MHMKVDIQASLLPCIQCVCIFTLCNKEEMTVLHIRSENWSCFNSTDSEYVITATEVNESKSSTRDRQQPQLAK
jgi:hypothetical protein